jgi:hypothetical protein
MRLIPILRVSNLQDFGVQADGSDIEHFRREPINPPFHPTSKVIPPRPHLLHTAESNLLDRALRLTCRPPTH